MTATSTALPSRGLEPLTVAHSRANCVLLAVCVASVYLLGGIFGGFFVLFAVWQLLRTIIARTVFYDDRLEHRGLFGRTIRADYANVGMLSSWPDAIMLTGQATGGKRFSFNIGSLDGDTLAIQNFLKPRLP